MTKGRQSFQDAEIVPTTIGQYVRGKFGYWARRWVGIISLGIPIQLAVQTRHAGFQLWHLWSGLGAWAFACAVALAAILLTLTAGGWWHTRRYRNR